MFGGTVPERALSLKPPRRPNRFWGQTPGGVSPSGALLMAEQLVVRDFPDLASRGADDDGTCRHVADDDCAGADEGLLTDLDPG